MKIIDLLNKIANGEEMPKKIIGKDSLGKKEEYIYNDFWYIHIFENPDGEEDYYYMNRDISNLNDEVEVIEDNKKIEKLVMDYAYDIEEKIFYEKGDKPNHCIVGDAGTELLIGKINEIIEVINNGTMD